jgi:hypothetical protein
LGNKGVRAGPAVADKKAAPVTKVIGLMHHLTHSRIVTMADPVAKGALTAKAGAEALVGKAVLRFRSAGS